MCHNFLRRVSASRRFCCLFALLAGLADPAFAQTQNPNSIVHKVQSSTDRLEMTVNSSRILTLDEKIPRAQVNNPDVLTLTPLSPTQIQISGKKPGVTEINLWTLRPDGSEEVRSVDVIVYGDARELTNILKTQFPSATIKVIPIANSVVLSGFVDRADHVNQIIRIAEDYYPKVIPNITVGGVQQIALHVKVMEVSRTKLRAVGFDFSNLNGNNFVVSSVSGLISAAANGSSAVGTGADTVRFGVVDGQNAFFGFLEALRKNELLKITAEPTLVTVSGRPASFNSGGEFPILVPQSLGTVSIEYKQYGTQVDFVPIVLGNGNIRLEVRPRVSEVDPTRSVTISGTSVPALKVRQVDTGVEMKAGQTLALAGLVQERVEASNAGLPYLSDLPYFGVPFRRVRETRNEIELLILVRPELVEAVDCHEMPRGGPGLNTVSPNDCELYFKGYMEVPSCAMPGGCQLQTQEVIPPGYTPGQVPMGTTPSNQPSSSTVPARPSATSSEASRNANPAVPSGRSADSSRRGSADISVAPTQNPAASRSTTVASGRPAASNTNSRYNPSNATENRTVTRSNGEPSFIGPLGYDVNN